ncbi:hypothetical protein CGMCC3_g9805 [Colletotrichum fructicola]|uniref:Uncharacterized protein n=1 Tax=Colletotrichum fructicola (strain Nara gc5) TaxID=1213859 RepID=A0A7J6IYP9_COLFN|nr:uncharacterized protein CGMCC3_g9805 [Colletotrichum fructicola]KAE9574194.1 hypothetical protein CGMCC3_g9805 [Colletotrichum fructicola]KAF4482397.1 hypothetical protein CGGC5_v009113 [Colletotrichum fructicola Nara gc5]KAF5508512.1 hypothetical protein CGCF413_v003687 [Colletotrichum fructicola]
MQGVPDCLSSGAWKTRNGWFSREKIWGKVKRSAAGLPLLMMASLDQSGARAKDAKVTSGRERAHTTPELCNRRGKRHTRTDK